MASTSRKTLRRDIFDKLRDGLVFTHDGPSSTSVLIDAENLVDADNAYRSAYVMATSGTATNLGVVRRVDSSTQSTNSITLQAVLPASAVADDEFEMVNLKGDGFRFQEYHRAINACIGMLRDGQYLVETYSNVATAFNGDLGAGTFTIPSGLTYLTSVQYQDDDGEWINIPRARTSSTFGEGYRTLGLSGTAQIMGRFRNDADGQTLRCFGYSEISDLNSDSDTTSVPREYIVNQAAHILAFNRGGPIWTPRAMLFKQDADQSRPRSTLGWAANIEKVR